jgi:elongation factor Tu
VVNRIEAFNQALDKGEAGENVGVLLRGVKTSQIERGQVIAVPRTIRPESKFKAEVYVLKKEEGGRHTPFFNGYQPQFSFRTTDVAGHVHLLDGADRCLPGDNASVAVSLDKPIALDHGSHFAIREGGKTVGSGVVVKVLQ